MILNLYEIMSVTDKETVLEAGLSEQKGMFHGEEFTFSCDKPFGVYLKQTKKGIISLRADLVVTVTRACSRCLTDVVESYDLHIERTIDVVNKKAENSLYEEVLSESDVISYIEDCNLDIDMLVLDELYTILPMTVLCDEDCKGICKVCGINLNKSTCDCDQTVPDPRMAVFSDIFNQFKEV